MTLDPSLLSGTNAAFLDDQYRRWRVDPDAVDPQWHPLFAQWAEEPDSPQPHAAAAPSIFAGRAGLGADHRTAAIPQLINAYRVRGHMKAGIDPLGRRDTFEHPELSLAFYGLTEADLDAPALSTPLHHEPETSTLRNILARLRAAYCESIGAEFMNIADLEQKRWVQEALEALPQRTALDRDGERRVLRKLCDAEAFERLLHARFPGTKRFSLEGAETLVPLLDTLIEESGRVGTREIVLGMAHRGRLNTLVNVIDKPVLRIIREFEDAESGTTQGSGDVKYHLAYSADRSTSRGETVHLSLAPNPSHLEAVDPVVEGRARAKQDRVGDHDRNQVMPVLIHGDAAFAGQGLVAEVLNLSDIKGYRTGGTIHIIVNNQIGFTTPPHEARSTPYATDVARMLAIPIFHVNGEDPHAVAATVQTAVAWRHRFHRDVIIDMYCYRKHGHNEGDEPSFTQPLMYDTIRRRPTPRQVYAQHLVKTGSLTQAEAEAIYQARHAHFEAQLSEPDVAEARASDRTLGAKAHSAAANLFRKDTSVTTRADRQVVEVVSPLKGLWSRYVGRSVHEAVDTTFDQAELSALLIKANTLPEGFSGHAKIKRLLAQRRAMVHGERPCDWALAEQAAFASLLVSGLRVRLSGQDSGRGTFSHRHAVLADIATGDEIFPLDNLTVDQARFEVRDSMLSEAGVLGFEFGYSLDTPDGLVMWEAQFGDFANGAQVIIDNFIATSETKWNRYSGLVMLLPHGFEGQGPEHSSARLERYLQLCADENMEVANCTTPDNYSHLLRRQVLRRARKPLVVMTPKSLLRRAMCSMQDLATGGFAPVLPDPTDIDPSGVRRVVLCSGKVYYDLDDARKARSITDVAVVRVERLYPFPADEIDAALAAYPDQTDVVWCQEEPRNMGAWPKFLHDFTDRPTRFGVPRYVGRTASASPATGSHRTHHREQEALVAEALAP